MNTIDGFSKILLNKIINKTIWFHYVTIILL